MNIKIFSLEDRVQRFVENLLSSKATEFYLKGINKLPDKWQEVIKNDGEYIIDRDLFIVKLMLNKFCFYLNWNYLWLISIFPCLQCPVDIEFDFIIRKNNISYFVIIIFF